MNILFIHQNMPGQFRHLARVLAANSRNRVAFLTARGDATLPNVLRVTYKRPVSTKSEVHPFLRSQQEAIGFGERTAAAIQGLVRNGFRPDVVVGHPGWGELLFVKDVLPNVPLVNYCEFFYRGRGLDVDFDPEEASGRDAAFRARIRSSHLLLSLEACDVGVSPTHWQKQVHPEVFHDRIEVIFDGIDTNFARPDGEASLVLPNGLTIHRGKELLTYVARNLEPYRGFRTFMRALPNILSRRPDAQIVIVGGDDVSYGGRPRNHASWRQAMLAEVECDQSRVHFTGPLPYLEYLKLLRASRAHVYLTYPFVLSWSCLEAMACGALVIGSNTPPVREIINHGGNGLLTDFFDHSQLAAIACDALAKPEKYVALRQQAVETIRRNYSLTECLPRQLALLQRAAQGSF